MSRNLATVVVRGVLPAWAKEKKNWTVAQWSKVLFSDENKFCISFGNRGPRFWRKGGEAHSPSCLKSIVKFPQSVMIWGAMSSAGLFIEIVNWWFFFMCKIIILIHVFNTQVSQFELNY